MTYAPKTRIKGSKICAADVTISLGARRRGLGGLGRPGAVSLCVSSMPTLAATMNKDGDFTQRVKTAIGNQDGRHDVGDAEFDGRLRDIKRGQRPQFRQFSVVGGQA